ncbi:hypothetical protein [Rubripirellula reticaptiva]|uniref:Lipocalin-like domain-containing protein n=1 Tax=Rubripirellula reticaptiva TaxID=2528013 RepID=A0A5C6EQF7_9BACT|nr:hypothetical protein [Rubripirellula reticaptiva]TWU52013.1 hypothetical protein Poly59_36100 [Rubripirellula reticaptiva]
MHRNSLFLLGICTAICYATYAAEEQVKKTVKGKWTLTTAVANKIIDARSDVLGPIPEGVEFLHLDDGEFHVPDELSGSKRHTLPRGLHFCFEPVVIQNDAVIADLTLCYSNVDSVTENGFVARKNQVDGRYLIPFDRAITIELDMGDGKVAHKLKLSVSHSD